MSLYRRFGKRLFDLAVSVFAVVVLAPVLLVTALLVRLKLGHPVLFRQERPGLRGESFMLYKFRSMADLYDKDGRLLPDCERLTAFGRFLRHSSLDELPELLNVIRGEMSLVGPRPLLVRYLERYNLEQKRRHDVLPGITGWAQVNGRNAISWEEKFTHDVWYVDHVSLLLDLQILFRTLRKVVKREGVNATEMMSSPEFMGIGEVVEN
jgi:sugar transferase EpsL